MTAGQNTAGFPAGTSEFLAFIWAEVDGMGDQLQVSPEEDGLDRLFMMHSPVAMRTGPREGLKEADLILASVVRNVAATAALDVRVPTASNVPGGARAKAALSRAMSWYVGYIVAQVGQFAASVAEATSVMAGRLARLEGSVDRLSGLGAGREVIRSAPGDVPLPDDPHWWGDSAVESMKGAGRVLHLGCGDGWLVSRLVDVGVDAYGADPRVPAGWRGPVEIDLRSESAYEHLSAVRRGSLDGVILSASSVLLPPEGYRELAEMIADRLASDAVWSVYSPSPEGWDGPLGGVASDLLPARPLRAGTWRYLLERQGFTCEERSEEFDYLVIATRGSIQARTTQGSATRSGRAQ